MLKIKPAALAGFGILFAALGFSLVGCGSSGGAAATNSSGRARLTIEWPTKPVTRKIPSAAGALLIEFKKADGTRVAARWSVKPTPPATQTSVEAFAGLPVGPLTLSITAYPARQDSAAPEAVAGGVPTDGARTGFASVGAQGIANQSVVIKPDDGTGTITLLMEPATKELAIVPDKTVVAPGDTVNFRVEGRISATDTRVVLLDPANLRWSVSGDAVALGSGAGVGTFSVSVTGFVQPFSVSVTDGESSATKNVQAQASPIAVGGTASVGIIGAGAAGTDEYIGEGFMSLNGNRGPSSDGSVTQNFAGVFVYPRPLSSTRPIVDGLGFRIDPDPLTRPFATVIPPLPASGSQIGYVFQAVDATIEITRFTVNSAPAVTVAGSSSYKIPGASGGADDPKFVGLDRISPTRLLALTRSAGEVYRRVVYNIVESGSGATLEEASSARVQLPSGAGAFGVAIGGGVAPDIAADAQGRLYLFGTDGKIHRFGADGSLDSTFVSSATFPGLDDLEVGADGLVYLSVGDRRAALTSLGGVRTPLATVLPTAPAYEYFGKTSGNTYIPVPAAQADVYVLVQDRPTASQVAIKVHDIGARVGELFKEGTTDGTVTNSSNQPLFKNINDGTVGTVASASTVPMIYYHYLWDFKTQNP